MKKILCLLLSLIEELAAQLNMSAETLAATLQTYNGYCAAGEDPDFGKDASMLVDLSEGPYYAVKGAAWIYTILFLNIFKKAEERVIMKTVMRNEAFSNNRSGI